MTHTIHEQKTMRKKSVYFDDKIFRHSWEIHTTYTLADSKYNLQIQSRAGSPPSTGTLFPIIVSHCRKTAILIQSRTRWALEMDIAMLQTLFPLLHATFPLKVDHKSRQLEEKNYSQNQTWTLSE